MAGRTFKTRKRLNPPRLASVQCQKPNPRNPLRALGVSSGRKETYGEWQMAQSNLRTPSLDPTVPNETANPAPVLTPVAARQGLISGRVRLVLVVSLTLVIAAFAIIYAMPA